MVLLLATMSRHLVHWREFVADTHKFTVLDASNISYHVTFVNLWTHGQLDDKPGGVPQDEGGDEVPVDDVSQAADAPVRQTEGHKVRM